MRGRAAEIFEMRVDLPTLGKPTRPTSAISLIEEKLFLLARGAFLGFPGRLVRRRGVGGVAAAALAALGHAEALAVKDKIVDDLSGGDILDHGPDRDGEVEVGALLALAVAPLPVGPVAGFVDRVEAEKGEGIQTFIGREYVAAVPRRGPRRDRPAERRPLSGS